MRVIVTEANTRGVKLTAKRKTLLKTSLAFRDKDRRARNQESAPDGSS